MDIEHIEEERVGKMNPESRRLISKYFQFCELKVYESNFVFFCMVGYPPRYNRSLYQRYTVHERALYFNSTFFPPHIFYSLTPQCDALSRISNPGIVLHFPHLHSEPGKKAPSRTPLSIL